MKNLALILSFCIVYSVFGQDYPNPFKEIGKDVEVLTLSNGEYDEFFPNDTIRRIGTVMFNTVEMKIDCFVSEDVIKAEAMPEGYLVSRFLSRDPIAVNFPHYSPYQFAGNKPIAAIDLDGLEEYIINRNWTATGNGYSLFITMNYNVIKDRVSNSSDPNRTDPNRKADINVNGVYSHSEQQAFDPNIIESRFEVARLTVYQSRQDAVLGANNKGGNQTNVTLKESMDQTAFRSPSNRGMPIQATYPNSSNNPTYINFNGWQDTYTFTNAVVYFGTDISELSDADLPIIDQISNDLLENPELSVKITGHTSMLGGADYNKQLSDARVQSVIDAITENLRAAGLSDEEIQGKINSSGEGRTEAEGKGQGTSTDVGNERKVEITYEVN
ncbi:OmpA family protein [Parvicella tangerina]|uniref:Peptidoglycan-associated lipoprotein n=1 Tax=Parvicella tangerina TaxID=2829795 RepID=A0A916JMX4_9FLAO|nr:OmpA family protein [Parvicella tangerina]CAG5083684.1 Peptidoglycan-associated lipoprotein [Parvicella tangerina]